MQQAGTTDENTCAYNDFALVKVDAGVRRQGQPLRPVLGRPGRARHRRHRRRRGTSTPSATPASAAGVEALSPKQGTSLGAEGGGWTHTVYTVTPGIPGDSGSGFLDANGKALGTLSTVAIAPLAGSNGVGDLAHELAFAQAHSGHLGSGLVPGTEPFIARSSERTHGSDDHSSGRAPAPWSRPSPSGA